MSETPEKAVAAADRTAFAVLILGAVVLGFSPILVRLSELGPTSSAFYRVFLAIPVLWLWMVAENRKYGTAVQRPQSRRDYGILCLAGFFFAGDLAFWHWSLQFTTVANATLLATLAPIHVALGAFLFFGQRFTKRFLLGVAVAVAGSAVLMGGSFTLGLENLFGDTLGFITGMFFGAYILTIGRLRSKFTTATIMAWSTLTTAVFLLPAALVSGEAMIAYTAHGWVVALALALITHAGAQGMIAYALAHLPTAFSSVGLLMEAVSAAALAWIILAEPLGPAQYVGAAVIMAGIVIARRGSR